MSPLFLGNLWLSLEAKELCSDRVENVFKSQAHRFNRKEFELNANPPNTLCGLHVAASSVNKPFLSLSDMWTNFENYKASRSCTPVWSSSHERFIMAMLLLCSLLLFATYLNIRNVLDLPCFSCTSEYVVITMKEQGGRSVLTDL